MRAPNLRYSALQAAYWALFATAMVFPSVFLLGEGLSNSLVGAVMAVGGVASVALQPVIAAAAERSRLPVRVWTVGLVAVAALAAVGLLLPVPPLAKAALYGLLLATTQTILPLANALGMAATHAGIPVRYGPARGVGSAAFAGVALGGGALAAASGTLVVPIIALVAAAALAVLVITFAVPDTHVDLTPGEDGEPILEAPPLSSAQRRRFWVLLVGLAAAYGAHAAIATFSFQYVTHHGGNATHLGISMALGASSEVLPMLAFGLLLRRWRPVTLLRFAAVMMAAKSAAAFLAPDLTTFLASYLLQALSFAVMVPASVYYVDQLFPPADRVRGQAWVAVTMTIGNVLAALVGGPVLDALGAPTLLAVGLGMGLMGIAGTFVGTQPPR